MAIILTLFPLARDQAHLPAFAPGKEKITLREGRMADKLYGPPEWPPASPAGDPYGSPRIPRQTGSPGGYPPPDARVAAPPYGAQAPYEPYAGAQAPYEPYAGAQAPYEPYAGAQAPYAPYGTPGAYAPPAAPYAPPAAPYAPDPYASPRHGSAASATDSERRTTPRHSSGEWRTVDDRRPPTAPADRPGRTRRADASRWHWLLLIPIVVPLMPTLYNRIEPTLFGLPFFYWSQLGFAFLASAVIAFVHRKVK
jgi:hypothetical protein